MISICSLIYKRDQLEIKIVLTKLEKRVLDLVADRIARENQAPTMKEIAEALGISSRGTVHRYVQSLIGKGELERKGRAWRGIRLARKNHRKLTILPLQGGIKTGSALIPSEGEKEVNFSADLLGPDRVTYRVADDGMREAGIIKGDYVIVQKTGIANDDDIVVALIDGGEMTLKRLRKHGDRIELIPANRKMLSLIYPTERVHIQGVVVGLVRQY